MVNWEGFISVLSLDLLLRTNISKELPDDGCPLLICRIAPLVNIPRVEEARVAAFTTWLSV